MNERNWEYKGVQLSNRTKLFNFQITDSSNTITYDSEVNNNKNNNGAYSTNVTAGARLFILRGTIYGTTEEKNLAYQELKRIIRVEDFPSIENKGFYTLKWTDKRGKNVQANAKVYRPLQTTEGKHETLDFEFSLLSEDSFYYSQEEKTANGGVGLLGGNVMPNVMPNTLFWGTDYIEVTNDGDSKAGLFISVIWNLTNPRVTNLTTGQTMKLLTNTENLIIDNRQRPFIITDKGVNIKSLQVGQYIYLVWGVNQILISCENYTGNDQASVYLKYRDAYE